MTTRSEATTAPRALLYVATEAGGAACWVDDIRTIEDEARGGCRILLPPYREGANSIYSIWTTRQVVDALQEIGQPRSNDPPITVTLCDTITGRRTSNTHNSYSSWLQMGDHDAPRGMNFGGTRYRPDAPREQKRYLIVATSDGDLAALNRGYPADLLARFDIPAVTP